MHNIQVHRRGRKALVALGAAIAVTFGSVLLPADAVKAETPYQRTSDFYDFPGISLPFAGWNPVQSNRTEADQQSERDRKNEQDRQDGQDQSQDNQNIATSIITKGKTFIGVPYKFGAKTGNTASFDCSSFTQYLYRLNGIELPRQSIDQSRAGEPVKRSELRPGDLVFFYSPIHHVAIYIGDGKILHTYGDPGVTITPLDSGWWDDNYTSARRVIQ